MTLPRSVLIRADAGASIGLGHVMRCLALAQELLHRGVRVCFAAHELPGSTAARLEAEGCSVRRVHGAPGSERDVDETGGLAEALDAEWVVVDGYGFDLELQGRLAAARRKVLWVDDTGALSRYDVDLVLNQNLFAAELHGQYAARSKPGCRLLLGPSYALLRRELRAALSSSVARPRSRPTALAMFGGADPDDLTSRALAAFEDPRLQGLDLVVLVGPANPRRDALARQAAAAGPRVSLLTDAPDLGSILARVDLCVSAAGSTMWELAAFGIPSAVIVVAENQRENARCAALHGIARVLGTARDVGARDLADAVSALHSDPGSRARLSSAGRSLVDGAGAARVVDAMVRVEHGEPRGDDIAPGGGR